MNRQRSTAGEMIAFSLPLILSGILQQLYSWADAFIVGHVEGELPLAAIGVLRLVPLDYGLALCTVCSLAMPLGLSTIVVPNAYGKDPTVAAGMALVSHLVSVVTIPAVFMLFAVCFG